VRQDPWPTLIYTHTPRRVQSSRTARLDALAIAVGCDKATDPETYMIHVSYDFVLIDRMKRRDSSQALSKSLVFHETRQNVTIKNLILNKS